MIINKIYRFKRRNRSVPTEVNRVPDNTENNTIYMDLIKDDDKQYMDLTNGTW